MDLELAPGKYVVAVSGGVDSIALLDLLVGKSRAETAKPFRLTVAHFDHGIRPDSDQDRRLVQAAARAYDLPFAYDEGRLGPRTSEAAARTARYAFLHRVRQASGADAIVTAHQQDDVLETAVLNLLRGTGRKGLTALSSRPGIARPLLGIPKGELIAYAREQGLGWREDSTNQDQTYLRNYIRQRLLPRFDRAGRERLESIITRMQTVNYELDQLLANQLHQQSVAGTIDRQWFCRLPHRLAREVMAVWLRAHGEPGFDSRTLERLVVQGKVGRPGSAFSLSRYHSLRVGHKHLALEPRER